MFISKTTILTLCSILLTEANVHSEAVTNSNVGEFFKFRFDRNKPLVYAIDFKSRTVNDNSSGSRSSLTRTSTESHCKIRLTPVSTNQNGTTRVYYEPFEYAQDVEIVGASGRVNTSTRGLDIVSKQNDIVVVDTTKGIGMSQAKNLKYSVYPLLVSGYFDFDSAGNVKKLDGDLPFIDLWQENLKFTVGFFHIVFPTNSIALRDSWTNHLTIKSCGGVTFNSDGIIQAHVFARELDSTMSNTSVACFSLYESDNHQKLGGSIEQSGQRTSVVIPELTVSINATFHFDQKLGRLIDMKRTEKFANSVSMMIQGNSATGNTDMEIERSIKLISP
jgi:hypothetical protein